MLTLLQASDLQYGKPYRPAVGQAFSRFAHAVGPDLIVVAGDLTQRAKASEFRGVRALLSGLPPAPVVVTPGNHDVPLYRIWERLVDPYRNWRRFMSEELDTVTRIDGATVVALNSAAPRRAIVAGHVSDRQVGWAAARFAESPQDDVRLLVVHHHFVATEDRLGGTPLSRGPSLLGAFEAMGVDAILGGHVHQTHLTTTRALVGGPEGDPGLPMLACGTTASSRGRGVESGHNTLNLIRIFDDRFEVTPHAYTAAADAFVAREPRSFARRSAPAGRRGTHASSETPA